MERRLPEPVVAVVVLTARTQVLMVELVAVEKVAQVITAVHQQTQYLERLTQVQAAAVVAAHLRQH
jgi:hypothetical protein